ncbi:hypothetical protein CUAC110533_10445 [Cutibacterium acnes subsp. elongatum]|jgi:DNA-binding MarR family transcriptional regulator
MGLVARQRDPHDARSRLVEITDAGREYCRNCGLSVGESVVPVLNTLSDRDRGLLMRVLPALRRAVEVLSENVDRTFQPHSMVTDWKSVTPLMLNS